jgi:hypothetical protein
MPEFDRQGHRSKFPLRSERRLLSPRHQLRQLVRLRAPHFDGRLASSIRTSRSPTSHRTVGLLKTTRHSLSVCPEGSARSSERALRASSPPRYRPARRFGRVDPSSDRYRPPPQGRRPRRGTRHARTGSGSLRPHATFRFGPRGQTQQTKSRRERGSWRAPSIPDLRSDAVAPMSHRQRTFPRFQRYSWAAFIREEGDEKRAVETRET